MRVPRGWRLWARLASAALLTAGAAAGVAAGALPQPAAAQPFSASVQPCTACHGLQGHATNQGYYPRIAGKPAGYLFDQMRNFRAGRRHFPIMVYFMQLQDDAYLRRMADYFAAQQAPYPPPEQSVVGAALLEQGRQLVMQGDAGRDIPACAACHGRHLLGVQPAVPGLLGVSSDYLLGQLGAWRSGARAAYAPDCMAQIARRLTPTQLTAVTAWLASQAVPAGQGPEASFESAPPMSCGSFTQATQAATAAGAAAPLAAAGQPLVERGRALVVLGDCEACHTARGGATFAGGRAIPTPFGTFYSPNITPDPDHGIGRWSEQDFWQALHAGVAPDGRYLYPTFPYTNYTRVTRADADAMFAYLRTLRPVAQANRAHALRFPYGYRPLLAAWRLLFFRPGVYQSDPQQSPAWNRGAYLVQGLGHCSACHEARNSLGAIRSQSDPAGGLILSWYAPSLTRPQEAGLQGWSVPDIVSFLRSGAIGLAPASDPSPATAHAAALGPMAEVVFSSLQQVADADLRDMATYLRSLPSAGTAAGQVIARPADELLYDGQAIYRRDCAACHGTGGEGHAPLGPPLAGNRALTMQSAVDPIRIVLFGGYPPGTREDPQPDGMPPFMQTLDDDQIAAVLTYVRFSWGNVAAAVDPGAVGVNRDTPLW